MSRKLAFFDLDGTLVSSNVVHQYNWFARNSGDSMRRLRLLCALPRLGWLEMRSRRRFNEAFFQHYRGLRRDWLIESAPRMFEELLRPALYLGAPKLVEQNHREGYYTVLLTGSLDFAIEPLAAFLKFDRVVSNRLVFADGVATGDLEPPVLAEAEPFQTADEFALDRHFALVVHLGHEALLLLEPAEQNAGPPVHKSLRQRGMKRIRQAVFYRARLAAPMNFVRDPAIALRDIGPGADIGEAF